jgi:hypothetical protein
MCVTYGVSVGANARPKVFLPKNKLVSKGAFAVTVVDIYIYKGMLQKNLPHLYELTSR